MGPKDIVKIIAAALRSDIRIAEVCDDDEISTSRLDRIIIVYTTDGYRIRIEVETDQMKGQ